MTNRSREAQRRLRAVADPKLAKFLQGFFRTEPGGYGAGDRFLGIKVPVIRRIARDFRDASEADLAALLGSAFHEDRFLAVLLIVGRAKRARAGEATALRAFYLRHRHRINQWDLVDMSAPWVLGPFLRTPEDPSMVRMARSRSLWDRRMAVLAHQWQIRRGVTAPTFRLAARLLDDEEDLIHKAVGWMLREAGQRDEASLRVFLGAHAPRMPRTMLRYAIEKFPPRARARFLRAGRAPS